MTEFLPLFSCASTSWKTSTHLVVRLQVNLYLLVIKSTSVLSNHARQNDSYLYPHKQTAHIQVCVRKWRLLSHKFLTPQAWHLILIMAMDCSLSQCFWKEFRHMPKRLSFPFKGQNQGGRQWRTKPWICVISKKQVSYYRRERGGMLIVNLIHTFL